MHDINSDEFEIDPVEEADRQARVGCKGLQYFSIHRPVKLRRIEGPVYKFDVKNYVPPPVDLLTCFKCDQRPICKYVDDPYNTNGDCLAIK